MDAKSERKWLIVGCAASAFLLFSGLGWQWYKSVPDLDIPTPQLPSPNAYDAFASAAKKIKPPPSGTPPVDVVFDYEETPPAGSTAWKKRYSPARREAWLKQHQAAFQEFYKGLKQPYLCPPIRQYDADGIARFGYFSNLRDALSVRAHAQAERGDWKAVAQTALDIVQCGITLPSGGDLEAYFMGTYFERRAYRELWEALPHLDAAASRSIAQQLETLDSKRISLVDALQEEKLSKTILLCGLLKDEKQLPETVFAGLPNRSWQSHLRLRMLCPRVVLKNYAHAADFAISEAAKPYNKVQLKQFSDNFAKQTSPTLLNPLSWCFQPDLTNAQGWSLENRMRNGLLRTSLALRAFQWKEGRYPQKLDELVPRYLARVPDDPYYPGHKLGYRLRPLRFVSRVVWVFDDSKPRIPVYVEPGGAGQTAKIWRRQTKPLHYETVLSYTLYSVGDDGRDDGGQPIENNTIAREDPVKRYQFTTFENSGDFIAGLHTSRFVIDRTRIEPPRPATLLTSPPPSGP